MPLEEDELYQQRILDHYEEPFHRGSCPHATHAHEDDNPMCGDVVRMELAVGPDGTIRDAYFNGEGCCISQASASMLVEKMRGRRVDDVKRFTAGRRKGVRNRFPLMEGAEKVTATKIGSKKVAGTGPILFCVPPRPLPCDANCCSRWLARRVNETANYRRERLRGGWRRRAERACYELGWAPECGCLPGRAVDRGTRICRSNRPARWAWGQSVLFILHPFDFIVLFRTLVERGREP